MDKNKGSGNRGGKWGWLGWWGGMRGKHRKLYLSNNEVQRYLIKRKILFIYFLERGERRRKERERKINM